MLNLKEAATFTSNLLKGKCSMLLSIHSLITFCVPQSKSKTHYHPFYAAKLHVKRKYVRANVQQNCLLKMICRRSCEEKWHVFDAREDQYGPKLHFKRHYTTEENLLVVATTASGGEEMI